MPYCEKRRGGGKDGHQRAGGAVRRRRLRIPVVNGTPRDNREGSLICQLEKARDRHRISLAQKKLTRYSDAASKRDVTVGREHDSDMHGGTRLCSVEEWQDSRLHPCGARAYKEQLSRMLN